MSVKRFVVKFRVLAINYAFVLLGLCFCWITYAIWIKKITFDKTLISIGDSVSIGLTTEMHNNLFGMMVSILYLISCIYSIGYNKEYNTNAKLRFHAIYFSSSILAFLISISVNLLTVFVFYETLTLTTYTLICFTKSKQSVLAAKKYLLSLMIPSFIFLLPVIMIIYLNVGNTTFTYGGILNNSSFTSTQIEILYFMTLFGIAKTAIIPLHQWLPTAMIASIPVSGLLHAVAVVKGGIMTLILFTYYIFGAEILTNSIEFFFGLNWFTWICVIGTIYASVNSLSQDKIKLRLAYSTIAHLSMIMIIISLFDNKLISLAIQYVIAHGFTKILLFYATGAIYNTTNRDTLTKLNGIGKLARFPIFAFTFGMFFIIGLHGSGMYAVKRDILETMIHNEKFILLATVIIGTISSTISLSKIPYYAFFRSIEENACEIKIHNLDYRMRFAILFLIVANFAMYLFEKVLFV